MLDGNCAENFQNQIKFEFQISCNYTSNSKNVHLPKPQLRFTKWRLQFMGVLAQNEITQQSQQKKLTLSKLLHRRNEAAAQKLRLIISAF